MIKLSDITVIGVCHPNIFERDNEFGCVDLVFSIDYKVNATQEDLNQYDLEEGLTEQDLKLEFASYMMMTIDAVDFKDIDNMCYSQFDYIVTSDVAPEIEESDSELSDIEKEKAFKLAKEYIKSDSFKKELDRLFN